MSIESIYRSFNWLSIGEQMHFFNSQSTVLVCLASHARHTYTHILDGPTGILCIRAKTCECQGALNINNNNNNMNRKHKFFSKIVDTNALLLASWLHIFTRMKIGVFPKRIYCVLGVCVCVCSMLLLQYVVLNMGQRNIMWLLCLDM